MTSPQNSFFRLFQDPAKNDADFQAMMSSIEGADLEQLEKLESDNSEIGDDVLNSEMQNMEVNRFMEDFFPNATVYYTKGFQPNPNEDYGDQYEEDQDFPDLPKMADLEDDKPPRKLTK